MNLIKAIMQASVSKAFNNFNTNSWSCPARKQAECRQDQIRKSQTAFQPNCSFLIHKCTQISLCYVGYIPEYFEPIISTALQIFLLERVVTLQAWRLPFRQR